MIDSIIISGFGLGGVFTIAIAISATRRWLNLRQNGVTVEGRITGCYHIDRGSEGTSYNVTYSYEYDGKAYWDEQSVSRRRYEALDNGMNVPIRCLPNNPKVATLVGENDLTLSPIMLSGTTTLSGGELRKSWENELKRVNHHRLRRFYLLSPIMFLIMVIVVCIGGIVASTSVATQNSPPMPTAAPTASLPDGIGVTQAADGEYIGISDGTFAFDTNRPDGNLKRQAADKLKTNDVSGAQSLWQSGLAADTNDAEALIYLEDQRVLTSGNPYITLVVGTMITGDNVGVGRDDLQGAYIAQKEFNDGLELSNNVEVRLLIANSGNVSAYATTVAQQIVQAAQQDHTIVGVMGWPYSSRALNAIGVLAKAHIPMVSQTASSDQLTGISSYFFRVAPSNKGQAIAGAQYAERVLHARNVALFVDPADSYSSSLATDFSQRFVADGNHIVVTENYTVGAQGQGKLPTLLQDALSHNPDLIYFSGYSTDISVLLTNLPTTGPSASLQILGGDALYEVGGYSSSARANFTRLHFTAFAYPDEWDVAYLTAPKPAFFNEYISAYNPNGQQPAGKYGYTRPSSDVMLSYDATLALLTGTNIALSGGKTSITPTDLQQGLTQIMGAQALQGVSGRIAFGPDGNPINKAFVILAVDAQGHIHEVGLQGCFLATPYRILCNGAQQKSPETRPGPSLEHSRNTSLHKIRYGICFLAGGTCS